MKTNRRHIGTYQLLKKLNQRVWGGVIFHPSLYALI